jgi:hypothetical protein
LANLWNLLSQFWILFTTCFSVAHSRNSMIRRTVSNVVRKLMRYFSRILQMP